MTEPGVDHLGKLPQTCGHHCGIRSQAEGQHSWEGHCNCPECRCPAATVPAPLGEVVRRKTPMCWGRRTGPEEELPGLLRAAGGPGNMAGFEAGE